MLRDSQSFYILFEQIALLETGLKILKSQLFKDGSQKLGIYLFTHDAFLNEPSLDERKWHHHQMSAGKGG